MATNYAFEASQLINASSEMVTLIVGEEKVQIKVHKTILGYSSSRFDKALYGPYMESSASEITLEDQDPILVNAFVQWAYTGELESNGEYKECDGNESLCCPAVQHWVLADEFIAHTYANKVMSSFLKFLADRYRKIPASTAAFVYEKTANGARLRLLIQEMLEQKGPFNEFVGYDDGTLQRAEWVELLAGGESHLREKLDRDDLLSEANIREDLIRENIAHGFNTWVRDDNKKPYKQENQHKFMFNSNTQSVQEWVRDRLNLSI